MNERTPNYRPFEHQPWTEQALCAQTGPDDATWYPPKGGQPAAGKELCAICPVRIECLEYALDHNEWGVWGGTSEMERRAMRRKRKDVA